MAVHGGSIIAVVETLVHVRLILLLLWLRVFLFLSALSQVGLSSHHGPPEVVIPLRVAGTDAGKNPSGWLSYRMNFGGQRHIVHMKVNKHFLYRHLSVFTYTDQGTLLEDQPFVQNDCYYHGYVEGDSESLVSLNTCVGGFQGIIQTMDTIYEITPKRLTIFEHLVYRIDSEETQSPPMRCGLTDEEIARQLKLQGNDTFTLMRTPYEGWWLHKRYLEIAVVVDNNRFIHRDSNVSDVQKEAYEVIHHTNNFFKTVDIEVTLMGIEIWTEGNLILLDDIYRGLRRFCDWKRQGFNDRLPHDAAHIFSGKGFGIVGGLAYVGTVCNSRHNCGIESFQTEDLVSFANIVTHEVGHTVGMKHDDGTCTCGRSRCIMNAGKGDTHRFSNCSYTWYSELMLRTKCMYIPPSPERIFTMTRCGNSVVEEGEDCDCGSLMCIEDHCCQSNCTLIPEADCAFGLCCQDCKFMPSGTMCRKKENECDLPEWCNGTSHQCPEDVYMQDGFLCKSGDYCYEKRCNNRDEHCRKIFGKEAKSANQSCYMRINTRGDRFGHCGLKNTAFVRCNTSDSLCGRVQCENVTKIPFLEEHSTVHWTHFNDVTCWGTDYHYGMTIPDIGEVKDGTECGVDHICIQKKCMPMSHLDSDCSPETCNMKGVCNNRHHCHCNYPWEPPDCLKNGTGGSIDSGPPPHPWIPNEKEKVVQKQPNMLLFWLIPFFVLLLFCLILLCMRYKRKQKKKKKNFSTEPQD
uniref:Uncharacterized protein n=1 Tax=Equus asinus TaxID=9793 RepID=A0A8C4PRA5_EQUAS|nr:disintegrin and metalloproteinase domain-containing protein 20-like [Equus asinus]